jgi:hypothetical protein
MTRVNNIDCFRRTGHDLRGLAGQGNRRNWWKACQPLLPQLSAFENSGVYQHCQLIIHCEHPYDRLQTFTQQGYAMKRWVQ